MGLKPDPPEKIKIAMQNGTKCHRIIQKHVSGVKVRKDLSHIKYTFPIVERMNFDPQCKFEFLYDSEYKIGGYVDGLNPETGQILEIKTSYTNWSLSKFQNSPQRKVYAYAFSEYKESVLITGRKYPERWKEDKPKVLRVDINEQDFDDALEYIEKGIDIIESGDYTGGLDDDGVCRDPYCFYGKNCSFKV